MDEQKEEKTGNIQQRATHDDEPIPIDITFEILSRLPTKSIVRFCLVSKLWSSITTTPEFINMFAARSSAQPPSLLLTFQKRKKRFVFTIPQHQNPDGSYSPKDCYEMNNPTNGRGCVRSDSVQGLVLLDEFVIWNPTTRRFLTLPEPKETYGSTYLGYDPLEGKHKVLHISKPPQVLTLGAQESWRVITDGVPRHHPGGSRGRCFNGILYYHAFIGSGYERLMSFDVRSEKFNPIKFPKGYSPLPPLMLPYEGRLALVNPYIYADDKIDLYILKDKDGHEWTHERFLAPSKRPKREFTTWRIFQGVTDAGELIFATDRISESFSIIYFDPRRNNTRDALFKGIVGDEFRRRCRLGNHTIHGLDIFPNHMESLVSF